MNFLSLKPASNINEATIKTNHKVAGLFLFVSVFATTNAQADSKQDIADLEAFYEQVFGKDKKTVSKAPKTTPKKNKPKPSNKHRIPSKQSNNSLLAKNLSKEAELQHLINDVRKPTFRPLVNKVTARPTKQRLREKDPELVAFYEQVFGKAGEDSNKVMETATNINRVATTKKTVPKIKKEVLKADNKKAFKRVDSVIPDPPMDTAASLQKLIDQEKNSSYTRYIKNKNTSKNETRLENGAERPSIYSQSVSQEKPSNIKEQTQSNKSTDLAALFAKAFGKKVGTSSPSQLSVDLKINKIVLGEVTLFSKQGTLDRVGTKDLLGNLKELLKEHVFERVKKEISNKEKVTFTDLEKLGVAASYNSIELSLDLEVSSDLRKPQVLSMLSKKTASVREENKITAKDISGFLNMYTNVGLHGSSKRPNVSMNLEGSVNIGGAVFESTANLRNGKLYRDKATITYDKPEKLQRFSLGNVSTGSRNFQENFSLDGIRISKEFFMDPKLQISPNANESFVLDSDSEVEVFINNQLRQRFYLRAGIYALEDIGLYNGGNNIRVRIKDAFGKVTIKTSEQYYDSHLLKKGLDLYAITVGSSKHKPIISGYYQKGLTKNLTMSIDAQFSEDRYLLGSELITSMSLGSFKASAAVSGGDDKEVGAATRFQFKPNRQPEKISLDTLRQDMLGLQSSAKGFLNNWIVSGELRSREFSSVSDSNALITASNKDSKKLKARLQTNFSFNISDNWQGSLNLGVADYYDADENVFADLTATTHFKNGLTLGIGAHYDSDDDYSMNIQLSIPLFERRNKSRKTLAMRVNSKDNSFESRLKVDPTSSVGKNSLGGSLVHASNDRSQQQNLDISYRNSKFETNFNASNTFNKENDTTTQQFNFGFNNSLACVGSKCAISYPIQDSFAIVSGPSNQESPIALNNNGNVRFVYSDDNDTGLPDNYSALITDKKSSAVVKLESYKFQKINIDEGTLPSGYDTEKTEFEVFPRYHQGFLIKAGGEPSVTVDGIFIDEEKKSLAYKGGQLIPLKGEGKTIAFFSNKIGRFRVSSLVAGKYKLELFDYPDMETIKINVPDKKGEVHNVGSLMVIK